MGQVFAFLKRIWSNYLYACSKRKHYFTTKTNKVLKPQLIFSPLGGLQKKIFAGRNKKEVETGKIGKKKKHF